MPSSLFGRLAARLLLALTGLLAGASAYAQSTQDLLPVTEAYKLSADASQPGMLKLHWDIAPDYYLYRGRMKFTAGEGDEYLGDVETYHHGIDAQIPYTVAAGTTRLTLSVQYQGCHEVDPKICYPPHTEKLDLALPAAATAATTSGQDFGTALRAIDAGNALGASSAALPAEQAFRVEALATAPDRLLLRWTMAKGYYLYRDQTALSVPGAPAPALKLVPAWPAGTAHEDEHFGQVTVYYDQVEVPVGIAGDLHGRRQLTVQAAFQGCQEGGICYPVMTRTLQIDLPAGTADGSAAAVRDDTAAAPGTGFLLALLLAFGGGLILNLMPCVLPVLSIKAVSVLESGESPARARRHALVYTAGVLVSFAVVGGVIVGLRAAGHALGWGAQLQQPLVVAVLACVMFAVGLSMSGVVQFGASLGNTGASLANRAGPAGDFFTGVLAVVVASPCTAPFMGSALAYAFAAPIAAALAVFLMLGVGLALPFLLVGFVPSLARRLPRPGRWMETLKQVLAFPMYLTAVWLAWVLAHQRGADAIGLLLVAMVVLAMALWWFERSRSRGALSRALVLVLAVLVAVPLYYLTQVPAPTRADATAEGVVAYSPQKLAELRQAGTPVFVDMTADWCVTCKANEHAVLDTDAFRALLAKTGAVYMKGDWTDVNPTIAAFLQQYHSPGVPLYVVFPKGGGEGKQLPTVLTRGLVERALTEASR
ncbi:MAG: protein-disulfide reductase [Rhodanobacter sp. SCN 68-63]|nr:MAG: protein-disulfide reductase [Rhodanobacter sp. SCN 68-63]